MLANLFLRNTCKIFSVNKSGNNKDISDVRLKLGGMSMPTNSGQRDNARRTLGDGGKRRGRIAAYP